MSYPKMMMHAAKYPHCEVDRLLLGTAKLNAIGPVPSPFDCYMVNRSLKTLKTRMEERLWWPPTGPLFGHSAPERFISEDSRRPFQPSASQP